MLDGQFRIRDRATSLALLLHFGHDMTGMSFLYFLPADSATHQFLELAQKSTQQASDKQVAPGARLGLKRSSGGQARGDVHLVHIPDRFGRSLHSWLCRRSRSLRHGALRCGPLCGPRCSCKGCPSFSPVLLCLSIFFAIWEYRGQMSVTSSRGMVDINLFLDGQTDCFDVKEARIRFTRFPRASRRPTLKHMMDPSEWQATLPKLREAVWSGLGWVLGPCHEPSVLCIFACQRSLQQAICSVLEEARS